MYAVIASGGKQEKVAQGQQVRVELLDADEGSDVSLTPVMVVDGSTVLATPDELKSASVTGRIVGRSGCRPPRRAVERSNTHLSTRLFSPKPGHRNGRRRPCGTS
jgi:ribosomal protein L21